MSRLVLSADASRVCAAVGPGSYEVAHTVHSTMVPRATRCRAARPQRMVRPRHRRRRDRRPSRSAFLSRRGSRPRGSLILDNHDDFGGHAKRNEFHMSAAGCCLPTAERGQSSRHFAYSAVAHGLLDGAR